MLNKSLLISHQVFKNLQLFLENKQPEDDLFDRLNVRIIHMNVCVQGIKWTVYIPSCNTCVALFPLLLPTVPSFPLFFLCVSCRLLFWISTYRSWWMAWQPRSFAPTTPPSPCNSSSKNFPAVSKTAASASHSQLTWMTPTYYLSTAKTSNHSSWFFTVFLQFNQNSSR